MIITRSCDNPGILSEPERELASRLVDHWDDVYPALAANPSLWQACERLLGRYGQDMIQRIGLMIEAEAETRPEPTAAVSEQSAPPQRECDSLVLARLLPRTEAA